MQSIGLRPSRSRWWSIGLLMACLALVPLFRFVPHWHSAAGLDEIVNGPWAQIGGIIGSTLVSEDLTCITGRPS